MVCNHSHAEHCLWTKVTIDALSHPGIAEIKILFHTELCVLRKRSQKAELTIDLLSMHVNTAVDLYGLVHHSILRSLKNQWHLLQQLCLLAPEELLMF